MLVTTALDDGYKDFLKSLRSSVRASSSQDECADTIPECCKAFSRWFRKASKHRPEAFVETCSVSHTSVYWPHWKTDLCLPLKPKTSDTHELVGHKITLLSQRSLPSALRLAKQCSTGLTSRCLSSPNQTRAMYCSQELEWRPSKTKNGPAVHRDQRLALARPQVVEKRPFQPFSLSECIAKALVLLILPSANRSQRAGHLHDRHVCVRS